MHLLLAATAWADTPFVIPCGTGFGGESVPVAGAEDVPVDAELSFLVQSSCEMSNAELVLLDSSGAVHDLPAGFSRRR